MGDSEAYEGWTYVGQQDIQIALAAGAATDGRRLGILTRLLAIIIRIEGRRVTVVDGRLRGVRGVDIRVGRVPLLQAEQVLPMAAPTDDNLLQKTLLRVA